MDADMALLLLGALATLLVGLVVGWFASRAGQAAATDAAVAKSQSAVNAELVEAKERLRSTEEARRQDQVERADLKTELERTRTELDQARDDVAKYSERSLQVPALQQKVEQLESEAQAAAAALLQVSQQAAQKSQLVESLTGQLEAASTEAQTLRSKVDALNVTLNDAVEAKATLEEQTTRLAPLEQELLATKQRLNDVSNELAQVRESAGIESSGLRAELNAEREALGLARAELEEQKQARIAAEREVGRLTTESAELIVTLENERKSTEEKLALLHGAQETLSDQFKVLANQILEEKSQKFAEQNKMALGAILEPLRTQLTDFKGKVEEVYVQEGKDRTALAEQVKQLLTLNQTLSQDAHNLTQALKGNSQTQGAWGEWLLEQTLSSSGLMKDEHYVLQDTTHREDGTRARPDALINLPNDRKLVVDAKMSLVAYEAYSSARTEDERASALRGHLDSMKKHIAGLSDREYQKLYPSLDFVLMFIPLEPAFMLAAANDKQLFNTAWEKNVLLVSPSTLLFVLRTVAYLWNQENQNRNAQAIADRGTKLYEKFVDFVRDLEQVGQRIAQADASYKDAYKKLYDGNGNLVSQAQKLTALGVKASKKISPALLQLSGVDVEAAEELAIRAAQNTPGSDTLAPARSASDEELAP
jgi:DNA recombination protein RmuC